MIGYSFTRFVEFPCGITYCFSVFKVVVIIQNVPSILDRHLSAHTVIVHAGANDVMARQLIKLQLNFECLTTTLKSLGKTCILCSSWVQNFCAATGFVFFCFLFFNNFDWFWSNKGLTSKDGIHPIELGVKQRTANLIDFVASLA